MAAVPEKVLNWLYSVLPGEYIEVNRTYHDVVEVLSHYPSLSPRTEVYTYENGASALLVLLSGTIPVFFRGATYGFPVAIWVPHAYPRESPIVYVTPSHDMLVRPGQHVSGDGRVYHPYLAQWGKYWDKSTIFDFLAVLREVFAKEPPVRSKQQPVAPTQPAPPPVPPPPEEWRRSVQSTPVASPSPIQASSRAAVPPPKPPKPFEQGRPSPQPRNEQRYQQPPPLPPHPQQTPHQQPPPRSGYGVQGVWKQVASSAQQVPPRQSSYDMAPPTPMSMPGLPPVQSYGQRYQDNHHELGSPVSPITPERPSQQAVSRYQQAAPAPAAPFPTAIPPHLRRQQQHPPSGQSPYQTQASDHYPPYGYPPSVQQPAPPKPKPPTNLLDDSLEVTLPSQTSSVPIAAPPIPPNPEKDALLRALSNTLVTQLRQTLSHNTSAIQPLLAQQSALQSAYSALQAELEQLQQLDAVLASNEQVLREAMHEADQVMQDARTREVPDVDDVLVAPTVVGGQLYGLCAEERAIGEAMFVLGKALDRGRIGAEGFVKQTRSLAREQFLKKALIKKIAKGLALDEYQMR